LQCPFIDVSLHHKSEDNAPGRFNGSLIEDALRALIESIRHRSGLLNIYKSTPTNAEPDIRYKIKIQTLKTFAKAGDSG